jgi:hypothetical protein
MSWWKLPRTFPLRIFLIALFIRLVPVVVTRDMGIGLDDMFQYDMLARSIASGNGYRWYAEEDLPTVLPYLHLDLTSANFDPRGVLTSFRPPLYPTFLALIYFTFGMGMRRFFIARLVQSVLAASMAPMTYALACRLFSKQETAARISAWIITLYPMLVIYPLSLATENLFFVLVLSSILALLKAKESLEIPYEQERGNLISYILRSRWFIFAGILLGLTCLTRSVAQIFAILAVAWVWIFLKERKRALVVLLMAGVVVVPWIVRNSLLYGQFTGIETALGYDLYLGYHPQGTGTFQFPQSLDLMTIMSDVERDQVGIKKAEEFIKNDPERVFYLFLRRTGYFFGLERRALTFFYSNDYFGYIPSPELAGIFALFCLPFIVISTSGVMGLALTYWRKETWLMTLIMIGYITPHMFIISEDRFHLAIVPFLAILSANCWIGGWTYLRQRWISSRSGKIMLIIGLLIILALYLNWGLELWRDTDKLALLFSPNGNHANFSY